jgi:putative glutamate/gamma-aminobutyrate antiporter
MTILNKKTLSVFGLVMINVIAVDSIRTLPMGAEYGFSLVFYYLLAGLVFFLPTALMSAELATGWPEAGGVYIWAREAFGKKWGFFTIWIQWFYNISWYPTIMSLIAATLAYCINPNLVNNKFYMLLVIIVFFWGATIVNLRGMKASGILSNVAAIVGTLVPMFFIILLGILWVILGKPIQINFSAKTFLPNLSDIQNLVLLTGVLFGLVGMEMSAVHAQEVKNPQKDYPKALLYSTVIILASLIFASLSIAIVVPAAQLNLVSGMLQAFEYFFKMFHLQWLMPIIALMIIVGALGGVGAWLLGPAKGLLVAGRDGSLPVFLTKMNRQQVPVAIILLQGVIFTLLCSLFLFMPSVSSSFWLLSDITAVLSLLVYIMMFSAGIYLRYKRPEVKRAFKIPGGKLGIWMVGGIGIIASVFTILIGFIPPAQIPVGNVFVYEFLLIIGFVLACLLPFYIYRLRKTSGEK